MTTPPPAARLNPDGFAAISVDVNARAIFLMFMAAAMLFAPLAMPAGAATAMSPSDHHAETMQPSHCDKAPGDIQDDGEAAKRCCVAMCAGATVSPAASVAARLVAAADPSVSPQQFESGFSGELPTPPPRGA